MKQNNMISFWRVIFTYVIMLLHLFNQYGHSTGWYIGVEFFFVVSGWLLAKDVDTKDRSPYMYTWHRLKRLYPEYIAAFIPAAACFIYSRNYNIKEAINWIGTKGLREILMIHYWSWFDNSLMANVATWYISVMLLAGLLLYCCLKQFPKLTKELLIPIVAVSFITYSYRMVGNMSGDDVCGMFYHVRFFRGLSEMGIGCLIYEYSLHYSEYLKSTCIKLLGILSMIFTIVASYFYKGEYDYLYLLLISIGVLVSFNTPLLFGKKVFAYFDKISSL